MATVRHTLADDDLRHVARYANPGDATAERPSARVIDQDCDAKLDRLCQVGLEALDLLGIALIVCQTSTAVLVSNQTADEILRVREGLQLNSAGEVETTQPCIPSLAKVFERTVQALRSGNTEKQGAALAVQRDSGKRPMTLYVRAVETNSECGQVLSASVLVMIVDSATPVRTSEAELYQLYAFTPTEARMANLLMDGKTLQECCYELGICHSTGCSHLKRLFKKTGVHRQIDLVALLLKSIGLLRFGRGAKYLPLLPGELVRSSVASLAARASEGA